MLAYFIAGIGLSWDLEKTWYKTGSDKPNREWDKTAAMMILLLVTESGHPVFGAPSAFERGKLDIKEYGKKSTRFDDNEENIEMFLCTDFCESAQHLRNFDRKKCKAGTTTHPKSQLHPLTNQKAPEHFMNKKYWRRECKMLTWRKQSKL